MTTAIVVILAWSRESSAPQTIYIALLEYICEDNYAASRVYDGLTYAMKAEKKSDIKVVY